MTIAERLKALEDALRAPMYGADTNNVTFGMRMVVLPAVAKVADELAAIRAEVEAVAKEMRGVENRVDRGHYTLGWADRLAKA